LEQEETALLLWLARSPGGATPGLDPSPTHSDGAVECLGVPRRGPWPAGPGSPRNDSRGAIRRMPDERPRSAPSGADILLVDDRPANLLALEAVLDGLGENLVRASSGEEALALLADRDFAV